MSAATDAIKDCRSFILSALIATMVDRAEARDSWIDNERMAVAVAANQWAEAHGYRQRITVEHIKHIEVLAVGHVDYASKLALYTAEFIVDPTDVLPDLAFGPQTDA